MAALRLRRQTCAECEHAFMIHDSRGCSGRVGGGRFPCRCPKFKRKAEFKVTTAANPPASSDAANGAPKGEDDAAR